MSLIVGVKSRYRDKDYVIIGADTQVSLVKEGRMKAKTDGSKLIYNDSWMLGRVGGGEDSRPLIAFTKLLYNDKSNSRVSKAITPNKDKERIFPEIGELNRQLKRQGDDGFEFVIATSFGDKVELLYSDDAGNVFDFEEYKDVFDCAEIGLKHFIIGTGQGYAKKFLSSKANRKNNPIRLEEQTPMNLASIVREAVRHSARDAGVGGLELAYVTPSGVRSWGEKIKKHLEDEEKNICDDFGEAIESELDGEDEEK